MEHAMTLVGSYLTFIKSGMILTDEVEGIFRKTSFSLYIESALSKVHEIHSKMYKGDKLNTNIFPVFTTKHSQGNLGSVLKFIYTENYL